MNRKAKYIAVAVKIIAGVAVILVLLMIIVSVGRFGLTMVNLWNDGNSATVEDPQFAEETEAQVTMPPELYEETPVEHGDRSSTWDIPEHTPVDKTAAELAEEVQTSEGN